MIGGMIPYTSYRSGKEEGKPNMLNRYPVLMLIPCPISVALMGVYNDRACADNRRFVRSDVFLVNVLCAGICRGGEFFCNAVERDVSAVVVGSSGAVGMGTGVGSFAKQINDMVHVSVVMGRHGGLYAQCRCSDVECILVWWYGG